MKVITQLAQKLNKTEADVKAFLSNAPRMYRVYKIPKRKHGYRVIAQPTKILKEYQRAFIEQFDTHFPVHHNAMAYRKEISIKENASFHCKQRYLLKMDLENFFNSINPPLLWNTWQQEKGNLPTDIEKKWLEKLIFWSPSKITDGKLILSVGAPSSPLISNFCMYQFDHLLTDHCESNAIYYTRYADDLIFSTNQKGILFSVPKFLQGILTHCFGQRLTINHSKTVFTSKAHNRHVTGITINNQGQLSLGRERKRYIKHLIHKYVKNELNKDDIRQLQGYLSFVKHIEPTFLIALKVKYSECIIQNIIGVKYG